jgi:hypothetical protein
MVKNNTDFNNTAVPTLTPFQHRTQKALSEKLMNGFAFNVNATRKKSFFVRRLTLYSIHVQITN